MARPEKRRLCKFVTEWLSNNEFSSWLVSVKEDKHKAYCLLCEKVFPVSHGGLNDVKAHGKGKRHNFLKEQQENRARETSTGQGWPTQGLFHFLYPNNRNRVFNASANVVEEVTPIDEVKTKREVPFEDELTLDSAISETECWPQAEMTSPGKMETPQQYCLRWKYHHSNLQVMFSQLLERESFCDVTLACEGKTLRAHKMMLSACSTYFDAIFSQHEENNPIVILKDVKFSDIKALVEFMYKGEINVENSHLSSLLKTAEELRIKGLAEVSWRSEGEGSWRSVEGGGSGATDDMDSDTEPPPTKKLKPPSQHPQHTPHSHTPQHSQHTLEQHYNTKPHTTTESHYSTPKSHQAEQHFNPKVTNIVGSVGTRNDYNDHTGTDDSGASDSQVWDPPSAQTEMYTDEPENTPIHNNPNSSTPVNVPVSISGFNIPPAVDEERSTFQEQPTHLPDLSQYSDVVKMNDYMAQGGRRPQFWEEPFTKRVMEAIKNKELEMKVAAELMGVSYGTLYGRYRDAYGCLKHPYRVRDFWLEQGPAEVLSKLQRKELTLFRAAEMLNVTVTTLANYLSTLRQGEPGSSDGEDEEEVENADRLASARHVLSNNPDITIVKRERDGPSLNGSK
ncbi:uncharacterized protein LOC142325193 [Lycorma delicatula]|uniref:uncharacterized protein LOC142325193 n=1 Tax=Lycorma delicatula TaxID=130591 RepID=UPI003F51567A